MAKNSCSFDFPVCTFPRRVGLSCFIHLAALVSSFTRGEKSFSDQCGHYLETFRVDELSHRKWALINMSNASGQQVPGLKGLAWLIL